MRIFKSFTLALALFTFISCNGARQQSATPSTVIKKYVDASNRRDVSTVKQTFSRGAMKMYEDIAQKGEISVDKVLENQFEFAAAQNLMPEIETRGEVIEGDTATVEIKNKKTDEVGAIPLVREGDEWKIELDKFVRSEMRKHLPQEPTAPTNDLKNAPSSSIKN